MMKYSPLSSETAPRRCPSTRTFTPASGSFFSFVTLPLSLPLVPARAGPADKAMATANAARLAARKA